MPDDILTAYAKSQPDKPGVIDDRPDGTVVRWTYAELEAQANRVANLLISLGAGPGTKVLWCGPNSPQVVAVMSAARLRPARRGRGERGRPVAGGGARAGAPPPDASLPAADTAPAPASAPEA